MWELSGAPCFDSSLKTCNYFGILLTFLHQIDLRDDPKTLARLNDMKEKPICVEQGQKLAKEVMEPSQNLQISVKTAKVILEADIYCALTVCRALC